MPPQQKTSDNGNFVTWPKLFVVLVGIVGLAAGLFAWVFHLHASYPHPGAVTRNEHELLIEFLKEDIADTKSMKGDLQLVREDLIKVKVALEIAE